MRRCAKHRVIQELYDEQQRVEVDVSRAIWLKTTPDAMELQHHATLLWWRLKLSSKISEAERPACCEVSAEARATFARLCEEIRAPLLSSEYALDPQHRLDLLSAAATERIAARHPKDSASYKELARRIEAIRPSFYDSLRLITQIAPSPAECAQHSDTLVAHYHLALRKIVGPRRSSRAAPAADARNGESYVASF